MIKPLEYKIYNRDCRSMAELADNSMQCVVTSPPYWGLRKYAGQRDLVWGGRADCRHEWSGEKQKYQRGNVGSHSTLQGGSQRPESKNGAQSIPQGQFCSLCGAWRGDYGLEPTIGLYLQHSIEILREVRRVLRPDGVVFWNVGDSYASGKGTCYNPGGGRNSLEGHAELKDAQAYPLNRGNKSTLKADNLKPKDLCLIPFRVAIAAQEDGWWVRSVIIWSKPNPMPESVTDRPTESHEYILMLTKSARYYWDAEAVKEPQKEISIKRAQRAHDTPYDPGYPGGVHNHVSEYYKATEGKPVEELRELLGGRNLRSVWTFPTHGFSGAHFAVFPEKLPEICIKAATPEYGVCAKCGAPWVRVIEKKPSRMNIRVRDAKAGRGTAEEGYKATQEEIDNYDEGNHPDMGWTKTLGWRPTCKCGCEERAPALVLDPFNGAGTTAMTAVRLGRSAVGYELSAEYCELTRERLAEIRLEMPGL